MNRPEQALQIAAVQYIRLAWPDLVFWFVPNGGNLSKVQRAKFQQMGLLSGVPDLHFILPPGRLGCIELKAGCGKLSETQAVFRDHCKANTVRWAQARSLEEIEAVLDSWLLPLGWKPRARL